MTGNRWPPGQNASNNNASNLIIVNIIIIIIFLIFCYFEILLLPEEWLESFLSILRVNVRHRYPWTVCRSLSLHHLYMQSLAATVTHWITFSLVIFAYKIVYNNIIYNISVWKCVFAALLHLELLRAFILKSSDWRSKNSVACLTKLWNSQHVMWGLKNKASSVDYPTIIYFLFFFININHILKLAFHYVLPTI